VLPLTSEFELIKEDDYLISLLGIVKECSEALINNLSLPTKDVFVNLARHLLFSASDFVLTSGSIGYSTNIDSLVSWAPGWSAVTLYRQGPLLFTCSDFAQVSEIALATGSSQYSCGTPRGSPRAKPGVQVEGLQLLVKSVGVSRIFELSPPFVVPLSKHISDTALFLSRKSELTAVNKTERLLRHLPSYYTQSSG
jgi:hypothetical protein